MNKRRYISPEVELEFMDLNPMMAISLGGGAEDYGARAADGGNLDTVVLVDEQGW